MSDVEAREEAGKAIVRHDPGFSGGYAYELACLAIDVYLQKQANHLRGHVPYQNDRAEVHSSAPWRRRRGSREGSQ